MLDETVSAQAMAHSGGRLALLQQDAHGPRCSLEPWIKAAWPLKSAFPGGFHLSDAVGDSPEAATDIVGVGIASVAIPKGGLRKAFAPGADVTVLGRTKKAARGTLIVIQTAGAPGPIGAGNPSWSVATDRNGDQADNVPVSIDVPDGPFENTQNAFHYLFRADGTAYVGVTDFAGKEVNGSRYYNDRADVAVARLPDGVAFLIPTDRLGAQLRVSTSVDGQSDLASLSADGAAIPLDGVVPATLGCTERSITHDALTVGEVRIGDEAYSDVPFPSYTTIGDCKRLVPDEIVALGSVADDQKAWISTRDPDGLVVEQHVPVDWWSDGERLYLVMDVGLTGYGHTALRSIAFDETGNEVIDDVLQDNADYLEYRLAPLSVDASQGSLGGVSCVPVRPA